MSGAAQVATVSASPAASAEAKGAASKELVGIQLLRGWAAATVAFSHLIGQIGHSAGVSLSEGLFPGAMGVDIFFAISGFIMIYTTHAHFGAAGEWRRFLTKRIVRIVPLYWFFTLLTVAALIVAPDIFNTTTLEWKNIISSLFFFPYARESGAVRPVLSLGWTLNYEMFFYLIFTIGLLFRRSLGLMLILGTLLFLVVLGRVEPFRGQDAVRFWTRDILAEFLFGILVGLAYLRAGSRSVPLASWLLLFGAVIGLSMWTTWLDQVVSDGVLRRAMVWGIPATLMLMLATLLVPARGPRPLRRIGAMIGDSSYALYLSHRFIFGAGILLWSRIVGFDTLPVAFPIIILFIGSLVGGYVVHRLIERPVLGWLKIRLARWL